MLTNNKYLSEMFSQKSFGSRLTVWLNESRATLYSSAHAVINIWQICTYSRANVDFSPQGVEGEQGAPGEVGAQGLPVKYSTTTSVTSYREHLKKVLTCFSLSAE